MAHSVTKLLAIRLNLSSSNPHPNNCIELNRLLFSVPLEFSGVTIFRHRTSLLLEAQYSRNFSPKLEETKMLGFIALVLIVLWLLGFLAFHISSGLIHILLVIGIVMLVFHFLRGSPRTA
jgi:hypothetical protein